MILSAVIPALIDGTGKTWEIETLKQKLKNLPTTTKEDTIYSDLTIIKANSCWAYFSSCCSCLPCCKPGPANPGETLLALESPILNHPENDKELISLFRQAYDHHKKNIDPTLDLIETVFENSNSPYIYIQKPQKAALKEEDQAPWLGLVPLGKEMKEEKK